MAVLSTTLGATFTPAAGDFIVQCDGGAVYLERQNNVGAPWANAGRIERCAAVIVANPVAGAVYRVTAVDTQSPVTFSADQ